MSPDVPEMADAELIARVRAGAVNDFEPLITRHRTQVMAIVARHVPGGRVAETAHEVFVRAFLSLATYRAERPFSHWLARIAVRTCYDFWRQQKRRPETLAGDLNEEYQVWLDRMAQSAAQATFVHDVASREAAEVLEWARSGMITHSLVLCGLFHFEGWWRGRGI